MEWIRLEHKIFIVIVAVKLTVLVLNMKPLVAETQGGLQQTESKFNSKLQKCLFWRMQTLSEHSYFHKVANLPLQAYFRCHAASPEVSIRTRSLVFLCRRRVILSCLTWMRRRRSDNFIHQRGDLRFQCATSNLRERRLPWDINQRQAITLWVLSWERGHQQAG